MENEKGIGFSSHQQERNERRAFLFKKQHELFRLKVTQTFPKHGEKKTTYLYSSKQEDRQGPALFVLLVMTDNPSKCYSQTLKKQLAFLRRWIVLGVAGTSSYERMSPPPAGDSGTIPHPSHTHELQRKQVHCAVQSGTIQTTKKRRPHVPPIKEHRKHVY